MKAKVVKERKKIKIKIIIIIISQPNRSQFLIAMFSNLSHSGVKNPFTARMLSFEVLNLVK